MKNKLTSFLVILACAGVAVWWRTASSVRSESSTVESTTSVSSPMTTPAAEAVQGEERAVAGATPKNEAPANTPSTQSQQQQVSTHTDQTLREHMHNLPAPGVSEVVILEFEKGAVRAIRVMPRLKDLEGLDDHQTHHMPPAIAERIRPLADIADQLAANPGLKKKAIEFYKHCALTPDFLPAVRARCLANCRRLAQEESVDVSDLKGQFPPDIEKLSEFIP